MSDDNSIQAAVDRATRWRRTLVDRVDLRSPMAAVLAESPEERRRLLHFWAGRSPGNRLSEGRFRWELHHERAGAAEYCPPRDEWSPWRPRDQAILERKPEVMEVRLTLPISVCEGISVLAELAATQDEELAMIAAEILDETVTVARTDLALNVRATHAWTDMFALSCLTRSAATLERMRAFSIAIATCYVANVRKADGELLGTRFPFHGRPLTSGTAMLASSLLSLGFEIDVASKLVASLAAHEHPGGGFGDDDQPRESFTTLLACELLARIDPGFDLGPSTAFLIDSQRRDGSWRALGPEVPWLTRAIARLLRCSALSFSERFQWPNAARANLDSKTDLPTYAYFVELAEMFSRLPGLAAAGCELAFIDLAGFRAFNNKYGQERGDEVLAEFAKVLGRVPQAVAIRDGGDEFLLVGAPTATSLSDGVEAVRATWPKHFVAAFGGEAPPVVARYITAIVDGRQLRHGREVLGRTLGTLKGEPLDPDGRGARLDLGAI